MCVPVWCVCVCACVCVCVCVCVCGVCVYRCRMRDYRAVDEEYPLIGY